MNGVRAYGPTVNRRALATEAINAVISTRAKAGLDQHSPICIYGLCETLGVVVRFNDIDMEGMYQRGEPPRIHLSAHRPLPRRRYNCAHELGHHVFGHGSSIDALCEEQIDYSWKDPKEFLADAFAGFMLMPIIGLRRAFAVRGWNPATVTAAQMYAIACDFGVGYATLLTHLSMSVSMISRARANALQRIKPKALRAEILDAATDRPLIVADHHRPGPTLDAEVNMFLLLPPGTERSGESLAYDRDIAGGRLFRAVRPGIARVTAQNSAWAVYVRIAPEAYVGLAMYRHLEDDPDE
jgi:Zn-dependent peptidase ImmA (M78 family)